MVMMNFLLFCPIKADPPNPLVLKTWLPDLAWGSVQKLIEIEMFEKFANDLEKEAPSENDLVLWICLLDL